MKFYNGSGPEGAACLMASSSVDENVGGSVGFGGDSAVRMTSVLSFDLSDNGANLPGCDGTSTDVDGDNFTTKNISSQAVVLLDWFPLMVVTSMKFENFFA